MASFLSRVSRTITDLGNTAARKRIDDHFQETHEKPTVKKKSNGTVRFAFNVAEPLTPLRPKVQESKKQLNVVG